MIDQVVFSECSAFMDGLKSNSIKLTVTSPPYDGLRLYNGFTFNFELIAQHLWRITEDGGVVVWVVGIKLRMVQKAEPVLNKRYTLCR